MMCAAHPANSAAGFVGVEPVREGGRRQQRVQAEALQGDRVARHVHDRPEDLGGKLVEVLDEPRERAMPRLAVGSEPGDGVVERADQDRGAAPVERVREVDLGPAPLQAVLVERERREKR